MGRDAQKQRALKSAPYGLPGTPAGQHSAILAKEADGCRCGRCTNERLQKGETR